MSGSIRAACVLVLACSRCAWADGPVVRVGFDASVCDHAVSGRLIVLMKNKASSLGERAAPLDGPYWEEEQPLFAVDVKDLKPGAWAEVGAGASAFPVAIDKLP